MDQPEQTPAARTDDTSSGRAKLRAIGVAIGLVILALVLSALVGVLVAVPLFIAGLDIENTAVFVVLLVGGQIGFFAAGYLYVRRYDLAVPIDRPEPRDLGYAVVGVVAALGFATGAGAVMTRVGLVPNAALEEIVTQDPTIALWLAVLSILVVAPAEEYLFRGVIQGRLRETFTAPAAILTASLLFGAMHFGNYIASVETIVAWSLLIAGVGVIFGVIYERTNTLFVPILAHAAYNAFLFTIGYLTV